jgi:pimeloyl-ACP methyl ester carboxylesterase
VQIDNDGIELHVAEDGDPTAPPVLLLHGITSFVGTWDWFLPDLAARHRVLRLDFRGHGASARAPGGYGSAQYLSDAIAVCEQVIGEPCAVIGHSLGGITALVALQQRPDLFRAAVLEDPPMFVARHDSEPAREGHVLLDAFMMMRRSLPALQASGIAAEAVAGFLAQVPTSSGETMGETIHADGLVSMAGSLLAVDPAVLDPVVGGSLDPLLDPDRGITTPTLIVTADPAVPGAICDPVASRELAAKSSAMEVVTIAGAGHLIHDEVASRAQFRALTLEFLDRVSSGVSS